MPKLWYKRVIKNHCENFHELCFFLMDIIRSKDKNDNGNNNKSKKKRQADEMEYKFKRPKEIPTNCYSRQSANFLLHSLASDRYNRKFVSNMQKLCIT